MSSQLDLDQGGTNRIWVKTYMGPSVGWQMAPGGNVLVITTAGTYTLDLSTSLVEVSVAGAVTIILPTAIIPSVPAGALPGPYVGNPITIVDTGGFAGSNPITIQPASVGENVMGLSSIQITANYGAYSLLPNSTLKGWNNISS